ncbi:MAG: response regulator [Sedimentisphaerales bacterium]|nr:response regulator [Sedimentisphaerales bacterium]
MKKEANILIAEDNKEHLELIRENLLRAGVCNELLNFADGQEILNFLFDVDEGVEGEHNSHEYFLLLNLNLPKVVGVKVLEKIKQDTHLKKIPVIILTATDNQHTIEQCYNLGCSTYIVKPTERHDFENNIQKLGRFLSIVEATLIN